MPKPKYQSIDRARLGSLLAQETKRYRDLHPKSAAMHAAGKHLFGAVPMTWMNKWAGGFPLGLVGAKGAGLSDVDGLRYVDLALGDTGAMAGHSAPAVLEAIARRVGDLGGMTAMLPTEDAQWVAEELSRRFGMQEWSFALSATDANRWVLRLARLATGRSKVAVFSYSYHGSVDESFVVSGPDGSALSRPGNVAPAVDPATTTRVAEFNDLASVEAALAHGDVAVLLTEPAMTNIGIVLPEPGFLAGLRELCDRYGTLLAIDETHTISAGPGGMTKRDQLRPDIVTLGKAIAGGIPIGAYGLTSALADRVREALRHGGDIIDVGGVGGTLAGNALSLAAARACLAEVLSDEAFVSMQLLATRFHAQVSASIERYGLPWSISQLGARAEYRFTNPAPRSGTQSALAADDDLDAYLHLYLANRGVLITPFHNMALCCPATTEADIDLHGQLFDEACANLLG
jgi:glutamate-1-semialdehyde 2,1-aminomutase